MRATRTYYEVLGVLPTASAAELRTAYRRLLRQAHPDMGGSSALLDLVNEAYDALKDPAERIRYDAAMGQGANTTQSGSSGPQPSPPPWASPPHSPPPGTPFGQPSSPRGAASRPEFGKGPMAKKLRRTAFAMVALYFAFTLWGGGDGTANQDSSLSAASVGDTVVENQAPECRQVIWPHCLHEFWPQHLTG